MKHIRNFMLACPLLTALLILPVSAKSPLVLDYANLITNEDEQHLQQQCASLGSSHGMDIVLLTVPSIMDYSVRDFADDFYDNNGYSENGMIFLLDMGSRQWHISTAGTAIEALSDRDLEKIEEKVIPYFSEGRYHAGFSRFLEILPGYLEVENEGGADVPMAIVIGAIIAGIGILIMRGTMNTKRPQRSANTYETEGSYHLNTHQDLFLYSNISKRARPRESSSGSITHRSSSGRSHGGRGGRF